MREEGVDGLPGVAVKAVGLRLGVALGHDGHVDAVGAAPAAHKVAVGRADGVGPADEDVSRVDAAGIARRHLAVQVVQLHFEPDRLFGEGEEKDVLERTRAPGGLFGGLPLLEKRRERVAVDDAPRRLVAQQDAPVP